MNSKQVGQNVVYHRNDNKGPSATRNMLHLRLKAVGMLFLTVMIYGRLHLLTLMATA
jgi:hypothetical protein